MRYCIIGSCRFRMKWWSQEFFTHIYPYVVSVCLLSRGLAREQGLTMHHFYILAVSSVFLFLPSRFRDASIAPPSKFGKFGTNLRNGSVFFIFCLWASCSHRRLCAFAPLRGRQSICIDCACGSRLAHCETSSEDSGGSVGRWVLPRCWWATRSIPVFYVRVFLSPLTMHAAQGNETDRYFSRGCSCDWCLTRHA